MDKSKLEKYQILLERKRRLVTKSYYEFFCYFWNTIEQEEFRDNWHIKYLCDELQELAIKVINREEKPYDLVINIPPGTSKSSIVTVFYQAWIWVLDPTITIISNSYSATLSLEHSVKTRDIVKSDKFKEMFGNIEIKRDRDNKGLWGNTKGGSRIATSTGATITGQHGHIIINDDPMNPQQAESDTQRQTANDYVNKTLTTRKKDKKNTPTIHVAQRLHKQDPSGVILNSGKKVKHICLPAELSDNVKPEELKKYYVNGLLDPDRLDMEVLKELQTDLGSYGYAGQIKQEPAPAEGGIIKRQWIGTFKLEEIQGCKVDFVVDSAFKVKNNKTKNDPCAIGAYVIKDNVAYLLNYTRKWLEMYQVCEQIDTDVKMFGNIHNSRVGVEPKATGVPIVQEMKRNTMANVIEQHIPRSMGKEQDKAVRLHASSPKIEAGRFKVLEGAHWLKQFIDELCTFPNDEHDEAVDITNMIIENMNKGRDLIGI